MVWFHGMGEGGKNKASPILNAKVTNLASEEIQSKFPNGFCILAPQCPTGWLMVSERTIGGIHYWAPVDKDKVKNKISGGMKSAKDTVTMPMRFLKQKVRQAFTGNSVSDDEDETEAEEEKIPFGSFSYYTFLIKDLIDSVISENPEIDTSRIFVGGCSAGGYMTLNMILVFRYFFRAAFPTCEFYLDSKITDEQIQFLSSFPIFFTYAKNDTTVDPLKATIPTIERMKKNGQRIPMHRIRGRARHIRQILRRGRKRVPVRRSRQLDIHIEQRQRNIRLALAILGAVEFTHRANHRFCVGGTCGLIRRMHCPLRKTDVHRKNGDVRSRDVAEG